MQSSASAGSTSCANGAIRRSRFWADCRNRAATCAIVLGLFAAKPALAIVCDTDPPDCPVCQTTSCNTATGTWRACSAGPNGAACDDGNACTYGDRCSAGACVPTGTVSCPSTTCQTQACN